MECAFAQSCSDNCSEKTLFSFRALELAQTESVARTFGFEVREGSVECLGAEDSSYTGRCIARVIRPKLINSPDMIVAFSEATRALI